MSREVTQVHTSSEGVLITRGADRLGASHVTPCNHGSELEDGNILATLFSP